ncbi:MAG: ABC transporter transmembrane domain-containing protein [Opitutales bacterium]
MPENTKKISPNKRLWRLVCPYWRSLSLALVSLVLLTCVNLATPLLVGKVFDRVFPERDWFLLFVILGSLFVLFLLRNLFFYQSKYTAVHVGENVCFNLRRSLFERLQQLSLSYTRSQSPSKISNKVMNDSMQIQQFIQDVLPKTLQAGLLCMGILVVIYFLNWQLALASTFILPLHLVVFQYFGQRIKSASRKSQENVDMATGSIMEALLGVEVVKGFTGEERGNRKFRAAMEQSRENRLTSYRYIVLQKVCADLLVGVGMLALIGIGAYQVIGRPPESAMRAGDFIAFFWFIRLLYPTVLDLMSSGAKFSKVGASVERAFELLEVNENNLEGGRIPMPRMRGAIEFKNVNFSFDGKQPILRNICFEVEAGEVCAITGPSGAGKSTLVSMVPLLLCPDSGMVLVDEIDNREIKTRDLRRGIGVVFQECFLFNTSILENIRYARGQASAKEIREICRKTGADEFIRELPDGYQTILGENGVTLSRGEKQLITITRAMLKNPRVLILDEATASLDARREAQIIPMILELMHGRTTLMITHNPKLLQHADSEIRVENGRVVSHRKLKDKKEEPPTVSGEIGTKHGESALRTLLLAALCLFGALAPVVQPGLNAAPEKEEASAGDAAPSEEKVPLYELNSKRIRLSHTSAERCLKMLDIYGINTGSPGNRIERGKLPLVIKVPPTDFHNTIAGMKENFPMTDSDPMNELVVFYDPDHSEQLRIVMRLIEEDIDIAARQIMIEAMILEISETGLDELGVEWSLANPGSNFNRLQIGELGEGVDSLDDVDSPLRLGTPEVFGEFDVTLKALMSKGKAEVLSRPSVLTLNNRMATINVSEKIPIAETKFQGNNNISTVNFRNEEVGIQLAVRPRANLEGGEVSMQINANVSSRVPNEDVEVRDNQNRVVAKSPTISVREVRTYARIANNTPFIIGGLIARDDLSERRTVPLLGDIPFLGRFFGSERLNHLKREVIIVIIPYVLPADGESNAQNEEGMVGRFLPKGEDKFDSFDNELFRDAYRIRDEDVFDLDFLLRNERLNELRAKAEQAVEQDYDLRNRYPFNAFANDRVPGEEILVYRQMYEVIKRIGLDEKVDPSRTIVFEQKEDDTESFDVTFVDKLLKSTAETLSPEGKEIRDMEDIWEAFEKKAVAITYYDTDAEGDLGNVLESPVPNIRVVDVPDRETYKNLFWELNQPTEEGRSRNTVLLHDEDDLQRLKRAIVLRNTVGLNAVKRTLTLENFSVGRFLLLPTRKSDKIDLVDAEVARLFFLTERYYDALRKRLRDASEALQKELEDK